MSGIEGRYKISVAAPFGKQQGYVEFKTEGERLQAKLHLMGTESKFEGKASGNEFEFQEKVKSGIVHMNVKVKGHIEGDELFAKASTTYGTFPITGVREVKE
ncbi:MAG: hypothetical protein E7256_12445 [Lachnospiraceae bacterium]|nr:hypothetical protein [Lachnospiraceae bacterium]